MTGGWPELPYARLAPTAETLRLWTQVAGKVAVARRPWLNHSWHVTLRVSARGLATPLIPNGTEAFQLEFDLLAHELVVRTTDGHERAVALAAGSVAEFYAEVMDALAAAGAPTRIDETPNEIPDAIPFPRDDRARPYDPQMAHALWRAFVQAERVFGRFRTRFLGKSSPIHYFWGSGDLALTRFSGRRAPPHPGGVPNLPDPVTREAYSHEVSSAGFWPGDDRLQGAAFYAYAYPTPPGFAEAPVSPGAARFDADLGEFLLPYDAVRGAADPDAALMAFLQSTYEAAADLAQWDRASLECHEGRIGVPRQVG